MKTTRFHACCLALAAALFPALERPARADNRLLPFQGRLSDANGNSVPDGARVVQFKIYDAPVGGRAVWNGEVQNLSINGGLVSTVLGTQASLAGVDFNQDLYLEVTVDANGDGQITLADPPLLPRQSILPALFAKDSGNSRLLDGYNWNALFGTNNPADGTLLDSKIGDNTLTTAKIRDNAITSAKVADGAITLSKLDVTGASAGLSLVYNGSQVVWSQVNAVNATKLNGYDWSAIFAGGDPVNGGLSVANATSRGDLYANGQMVISGRTYLNGPSTTIQGTLFAPTIGLNMYMNDWRVYLRNNGDNNHFLGYGNGLGNQSGFDGPMLVGYAGGVLGSAAGGFNWSLRWNSTGTVQTRGTITSGSDRNLKENFGRIDTGDVLTKVTALPISRWNYKDDPAAPHLGPVAQDFYAAFGLGSDDKSIAVVDADGVALAAIQGLNRKLEEKENEIRRLMTAQQRQIDALMAEIAALKAGAQ